MRSNYLRDHPALQAQHQLLLRPRPTRERSRVAIRRSRTAFDAPVPDRSFGSMAEQRTTNASGVRVAGDEQSLTVGPIGPTVLQDAYVVQKMPHFNRERLPKRVVHAKGSAAHGSSRSLPTSRSGRTRRSCRRSVSAHRCSRASRPWRANWAAPTRCATRAPFHMDARVRRDRPLRLQPDVATHAGVLDRRDARTLSDIVGHSSRRERCVPGGMRRRGLHDLFGRRAAAPR